MPTPKLPIKSILLALIVLSNLFASAQIKSFSRNPEVFITELVAHMNQYARQEVQEDVKQFTLLWEEGALAQDEKQAIRDICEDMLFKKLAVQPYFELFITSINYYKANEIPQKVLKQWQEISNTLLKKNVKEYLSFLQTANMLFAENKLYAREQFKWVADNNNFDLIYENNRLAIQFDYVTLSAEAFLDKMIIIDTRGIYFPDKGEWVGKGGKVLWERVGIAESDAHAQLNNYSISLGSNSYSADSVSFFYPALFSGPVLGRLTDQISFATNPERIQNVPYPAFSSYQANVLIQGIVGDMARYKGGFSLSGNNITGDNIHKDPITLELLYNDKTQVLIRSRALKIHEGVALSLKSEVTIHMDSGTAIYHPNIEMRYDFNKKILTLNKGSEGLMQMPFQDNYHKVEIDVDRVIWKQNTPYIEFDNKSDDKAAFIESADYFKEFRFDRVQGMLAYNPLVRMREYSLKYRIRKFSVHDYAAEYRSNPENLKPQLIELADQGFIFYDNINDSIEVRSRLYNYVNNYLKVRDYDVIRMSSVIAARPNVLLSLNNNDLLVEGVRSFVFSDSHNIVTVPYDQKVLIKKDRDMTFGGVVTAGKVDFYSKQFNFKYDPFMITQTHFDSMVLYYPDEMSGALRKVQSVLSDLYGTLEFDYPKNKSGLKKKDHPDYPIFTSEKGSKVHYEYPFTHNSIYKKEHFYFEVDPFRITNLDDFTAADLKLPGTFVSYDIFPDFKHELTIQPDFSLGFVKGVQMPMYQGKGMGDLTLSLSNQGLYGTGTIDYLGSKTVSESFLLLPHETVSNSESFDLPESSLYPLVAGRQVATQWLPYEDVMNVSHKEHPLKVFKNEYDFEGTLALSPESLNGNGKLVWNEAEFYSLNMVYGPNRVDADTSGIKIYSVDPDVFAFETSNVEAHIDFDIREGQFIANSPDNVTLLPANQYATVLSDYNWKMDPARIEMRPNDKFPDMVNYFVSTHPGQDSLQFESDYADFDLKESVLYIEEIPHIDVADSRIFLKDGKATVRKNASMDLLDSTEIIANRDDQFHRIYNTQTQIHGKYNIRASGSYDFVTQKGIEQVIYMDSIRINREKELVGVGYVPDSQEFILDIKIGYKGWTQIKSTEEHIRYYGFVKPQIAMEYVDQQWIRLVGTLDKDSVVIAVPDARNIDDRRMYTGLFVSGDSTHVYPMLFGMKRRYSDPEITLDSGILFYDPATDDIVVGDAAKIADPNSPGNVIRFNDQNQTIHALGHFGLKLNTKPGVKANFAGSTLWNHNTDTTYSFDWSFILDFPLPKEAVERMVALAQNENYGDVIKSHKPEYTVNLQSFYTNQKDAQTVINRLEQEGKINSESIIATSTFLKTTRRRVKEIFDPKLYINEVKQRAPEKAMLHVASSKWYFDNKNNAFVMNGAIDVVAINGVNINKTLGALIVIDRKRSGDDMHIYLELNPNEWIYFNYVRGVMYAWSTDKEFNDHIIQKGEKISNEDYRLRRGAPRSLDKLLRRFD